MDHTPNFITHYINQYISEDCVIELIQLAREYRNEVSNFNQRRNNKLAGDREYKKIYGVENPNSVEKEEAARELTFQEKAKQIASKHAKKEEVKLVEWKDEKSLQDKIKETNQNFDDSQEKMIEKIETFKNSELIKKEEVQQKTEPLPEVNSEKLTQAEERQKQIEELRNQFAKNRELYKDRER